MSAFAGKINWGAGPFKIGVLGARPLGEGVESNGVRNRGKRPPFF